MAKGKKELLASAPWRVEEGEEKFKDAKLKVTNQPGTTPKMHVPGKKKYKNDDVAEDSLTEIDPELLYSFQRNFQFIGRVFSIDTIVKPLPPAMVSMFHNHSNAYNGQSTARIEELLQEDQNTKRKRERIQKQSSLLSKLTRQLSIHDNRAAAASDFSNGGAESSPTSAGPSSGDDWRSAFDAAANGPADSYGDSRHSSNGHSRRYSDPAQNGDVGSGSNSSSRRTPNRLPPAPPQSGSYRF